MRVKKMSLGPWRAAGRAMSQEKVVVRALGAAIRVSTAGGVQTTGRPDRPPLRPLKDVNGHTVQALVSVDCDKVKSRWKCAQERGKKHENVACGSRGDVLATCRFKLADWHRGRQDEEYPVRVGEPHRFSRHHLSGLRKQPRVRWGSQHRGEWCSTEADNRTPARRAVDGKRDLKLCWRAGAVIG